MDVKVRISPIDLDLTLGCGQTFRWRKDDAGAWRGVIGDTVVTLGMARNGLVARADSESAHLKNIVSRYLRADDDIAEIQGFISTKDELLAKGMSALRGLRLVRMDELECLVSYVLATYANVPRISKMISSLASEYGEKIDHEFSSFPTMRALREASVKDLERIGLGYRARYVHDLCHEVDRGRIRSMTGMTYEELRGELLQLPGVGHKVADCVALFGFGKLEAFPIDVWIERGLERLYGMRGSYQELRRFASSRFGPYAGYAQEYIYHNERARSRSGECLFTRPGDSCDRNP